MKNTHPAISNSQAVPTAPTCRDGKPPVAVHVPDLSNPGNYWATSSDGLDIWYHDQRDDIATPILERAPRLANLTFFGGTVVMWLPYVRAPHWRIALLDRHALWANPTWFPDGEVRHLCDERMAARYIQQSLMHLLREAGPDSFKGAVTRLRASEITALDMGADLEDARDMSRRIVRLAKDRNDAAQAAEYQNYADEITAFLHELKAGRRMSTWADFEAAGKAIMASRSTGAK